jgi:abortive infection bacteriophage resistance protein
MIFQILSFGEASIIYDSLTSGNRNSISREYNLTFPYLGSWINSLSYLRNLCAHSDRVWNRIMTKKLKIKKFTYFNDRDSLFSYLIVINYFLYYIVNFDDSDNDFINNLSKLVCKYQIDITKMRFPDNWEDLLKNIK